MVHLSHSGRVRRAVACCAALVAVTAVAGGTSVAGAGVDRASAPAASAAPPRATIDGGAVRGAVIAGGYAFRGLPYAASPAGKLRWRAPQPPAPWHGVRDATSYGPSCWQLPGPFAPPPPYDEDCLSLNVSTPTLDRQARRPVLVWIHGGGLTQDGARNYEGSRLAAEGTVVVTINYRLGLLGFLAHPALARRPGGPSGNYGLMDQQAALRWVQRNIAQFGGDPHNVTIAGESAGGLSVLAHLVSRGSRGLFQRAIVQSGAFALTQQPHAAAEAAGTAFAASAGCTGQTAYCLRHLPVDKLLVPGALIPGVIDGAVLEESIGTALAAGRFARVPILNGINHDEERLFVTLGFPVSGGTNVPIALPVTPANYESNIAAAFGASPARAAAITAEYPLAAYSGDATVALSTLIGDANFACTALQLDSWTSAHVATFAYQFNDDNAPHVFTPPTFLPPVATHTDEAQYLFELPNAQFPAPFSPEQQALSATMRSAWASFAAGGDPSTAALPWPSFGGAHGAPVMSLQTPAPAVDGDSLADHHCAFWAAA